MTAMASAADLPARTMAPAPAPILAAPVFTWTGFYAGVHGGYITNETTGTLVGLGGGAAAAGAATFGGTGARGLDNDGFMFGGQIGGNVQFGMFVAGIEADISYVDIGASNVVTTTGLAGGNGTTTFRSDMEYFGTVRGRLGLAFDRVMVYATGGLAYADLGYGVDFVAAAPGTARLRGDGDDTEFGWTVGGGIEFAITNNLTIKGEYLYYEFDDVTVRATRTDIAAPADFVDVRFRDNNGHIGRVGINFKF
jgi:outer membrane immunogenic protein